MGTTSQRLNAVVLLALPVAVEISRVVANSNLVITELTEDLAGAAVLVLVRLEQGGLATLIHGYTASFASNTAALFAAVASNNVCMVPARPAASSCTRCRLGSGGNVCHSCWEQGIMFWGNHSR